MIPATCPSVRCAFLVAVAFVVLATAAGPGLLAEKGYETPPMLEASDVLPETMQTGDHFKVKPQVQNDGVMNHYVVDSDYGQFQAYGDLALARLIKEIHAISQLDEVSKTKVFAESALDSATGQVKTIVEVSQHPVGTVKGLPGGVHRMFHKYKRQAKEGYQTAKHVSGEAVDVVTPGDDKKDSKDDGTAGDGESGAKKSDSAQLTSEATKAAENYALKWFGVSGAERKWYKKIDIDPYTRNQVLRKKVTSVAHVDAAANFGMKFVPIPSIPGVDYLKRANDAVWTMDPEELRAQNTKTLQEVGVDEKLIQQFMTNENLSPSQQTLMLTTLTTMKGVKGLEVMLKIAAEADAVDVAEFNLANTLLLAAYHKFKKPVTKVFPGQPVPVALDEDNGLFIIVSADDAFWDQDLGEVITLMAGKFDDMTVTDRELWLRGKASPRFETEVGDLGWSLRQQIELTEKIKEQFTQPSEQSAPPKGDKEESGS